MTRIEHVWADTALGEPFKLAGGEFVNILSKPDDLWRVYFVKAKKNRTFMLVHKDDSLFIGGAYDIIAVGGVRPLGHPDETTYYELVELLG
jgi:hypothetical protein